MLSSLFLVPWLSLSKKKENQNKLTRQKISKQANKTKKSTKKFKKWSSFCVGCLFLSMCPALKSGWSTPWPSTEENRASLSHQVSLVKSFLLRGGTLCPLPPSHCWDFFQFEPMRTLCVVTVSASSCVCYSCWVWKIPSPCYPPALWALRKCWVSGMSCEQLTTTLLFCG